MNLILEENPRPYYEPARDKKGNPVVVRFSRRRNPKMANGVKGITNKLTGGLAIEDIIAGGTGLAAATMLPNALLKNAPVTTMDKVTRIGVSVLGALAMGYIWRFRGSSQAKAATIGGFSGIAVSVVNTLRPGLVGRPQTRLAQVAPVRRLGDASTISPSFTREGENVTLIRP